MSGEGVLSNEEWVKSWTDGEMNYPQSSHDKFLDNKKEEFIGENKSVFLPLCGKALDIIWFYNHGYNVCGVEIAEQAVEEFFLENNIQFHVENVENIGKRYISEDGRLQLYVADMYEMTPELCGQFDVTFDSKAFVAINKTDRQKYVDVILSLMKNDGRYYLSAIEFDSPDYPGPPHSTPAEDVNSWFGERCRVEYIEGEDQIFKEKQASPGGQQTEENKDLPAFITSSSYVIFHWYKITLKAQSGT